MWTFELNICTRIWLCMSFLYSKALLKQNACLCVCVCVFCAFFCVLVPPLQSSSPAASTTALHLLHSLSLTALLYVHLESCTGSHVHVHIYIYTQSHSKCEIKNKSKNEK